MVLQVLVHIHMCSVPPIESSCGVVLVVLYLSSICKAKCTIQITKYHHQTALCLCVQRGCVQNRWDDFDSAVRLDAADLRASEARITA
jgi:hypothetical protein